MGLGTCCHILALVILVFALLFAAGGCGAPWVVAVADRGDASGEALFLSLWNRYAHVLRVEQAGSGADTTAQTSTEYKQESWASIFDGIMDEPHCPEDPSKTNRGAYNRILASEIFSVLTVAFALLHVVVCCCYSSGHGHRCIYFITALLTICLGICTLVSWDFFLNYCDTNYCTRYVENAERTGGTLEQNFTGSVGGFNATVSGTDYENAACYYFVGFAFEIAAIGLIAIALLPMCLCGARRKSHDRVVYVDRRPGEPV